MDNVPLSKQPVNESDSAKAQMDVSEPNNDNDPPIDQLTECRNEVNVWFDRIEARLDLMEKRITRRLSALGIVVAIVLFVALRLTG